ncbi:MAG TPA: archaellin/type IV pilin N-terminal domain-containing protein [Methanomicrobiales archaeon]|jgi:flagellin FlaB|nr:archaellin/type IV pilin N-terminal domain-containing protein [Methanomicrobiales archaeon]
MKKYLKSEAFTGLEAAIVLIAFVVVAAVFSYVVLGAGFFTTQKAQQVVYSGVQQASSNIIVLGEVYGNSTVNPPVIDKIFFTIGLAAGGTSIDMNKTTFVYQNATKLVTLSFPQGNTTTGAPRCDIPGPTATNPGPWQWCIINVQNADSDALLERNEQFTIEAFLQSDTTGGLPPSADFTLTIRPDVGAALPIHKSAPGGLTAMNLLY